MTTTPILQKAANLLTRYRLPGSSVFMVGIFDGGITVLSQQVRALNLAWALIESGELDLDRESLEGSRDGDTTRKRIAVLGAGFAGLTFAAGLLKKRVSADITIFERRDTVLPLQQGSDSRWLHPHIYDWPSSGSEAYSAALPVLNWTASRASDVVVQVLTEWKQVAGAQPDPSKVVTPPTGPTVRVFCNTRHIQVSADDNGDATTVEWIGDERDSSDPAIPANRSSPVGDFQDFDIVVLTVGFGLEKGARIPYWRNETLAQPHLGPARNTYIVSGAGNGGLIDTFRLRISHYRQDRILAELFSGHPILVDALRSLHKANPQGPRFEQLRAAWENPALEVWTVDVQERLRKRLRQDTMVLLRMRYPSFAEVFVREKISFQNRLLAFLLYRCGAFTPVVAENEDADLHRLVKEHGVPEERIIIRHGTETEAGLTDLLAGRLDDKVKQCFNDKASYRQAESPRWPGGYFDMPGLTAHEQGNVPRAKNEVRLSWRKEYLPSPMEAIATAFCSAVAGFVKSPNQRSDQSSSRLRVTLHRTLLSGDEVVLQQCCDYQGTGITAENRRAGRTFPSRNGTVGAAFDRRCVVRTRKDPRRGALKADMAELNLDLASQNMADQVASVAAIPLLGPDRSLSGHAGNVLGVLYLDSYEENAFVNDGMMRQVVSMCNSFLDALPRVAETTAGRIANTEFWHRDNPRNPKSHNIDPAEWDALEEATNVGVPETVKLRHLNFDFSDFTPVEQK